MKHLMRYEGYSIEDREDDILDKISKYGIKSLTPLEKEFLDSFSQHGEEEAHNKVMYLENEKVFEDEFGNFKFEYQETEDYGEEEEHYIGTLYVPSITLENGKKIEGRIEGKIIAHKKNHQFTGQTSLEFEKEGHDVFEFCEGLEYELDSFIDYVVGELEIKANK
jgi:hypothetical protein